jgi:hypothetical protein
MSLIGSVLKDIGNDVKGVVEGAAHVAEGIGKLGKGALSLNPKEALGGIGEIASGGLTAAKGISALTPESLAATTLMEGGIAAVHALAPGSGSGSSKLA